MSLADSPLVQKFIAVRDRLARRLPFAKQRIVVNASKKIKRRIATTGSVVILKKEQVDYLGSRGNILATSFASGDFMGGEKSYFGHEHAIILPGDDHRGSFSSLDDMYHNNGLRIKRKAYALTLEFFYAGSSKYIGVDEKYGDEKKCGYVTLSNAKIGADTKDFSINQVIEWLGQEKTALKNRKDFRDQIEGETKYIDRAITEVRSIADEMKKIQKEAKGNKVVYHKEPYFDAVRFGHYDGSDRFNKIEYFSRAPSFLGRRIVQRHQKCVL